MGTAGAVKNSEEYLDDTFVALNGDVFTDLNLKEMIARHRENKAVATSGNYARYFDPEQKAHHIINPKTGYPAQGIISATVIADTATQADTLATSIFVMGPEAGVTLIDSLSNVECFIVDADRKTMHVSSGLSMYLAESEPEE